MGLRRMWGHNTGLRDGSLAAIYRTYSLYWPLPVAAVVSLGRKTPYPSTCTGRHAAEVPFENVATG
jgi:hypothetical protein